MRRDGRPVSRETAEANNAAQLAAERWRAHKKECVFCAMMSRQRKYGNLCDAGLEINADHVNAAAELRRNHELDKLPPPIRKPSSEERR
jgi:hypothetical protein